MKLRTKGSTLKKLKLKYSKVPLTYVFKVQEYNNDKEKYYAKIKKKFKSQIALRSSNFFEDKTKKTLAGKFTSILNINPNSRQKVISSINLIIKSYKQYEHVQNEILVQEMVKDVKYSGVIFSHDTKTNSPYIKINYTKSKDTTLVTSGTTNPETFVYFRYSVKKPQESFLKKLITSTEEVINIFKKSNLDIEFAIDKKNKIHIIQIRELKIEKNINNKNIITNLQKLEKKIDKLQNSHAHLLGNTTYFGVMPDWNPAEIIGFRPKPLALSLYKELITDHVWSKNRLLFGYKDVTSSHLMTTFFGIPYIDLRVDFNSWLPESLSQTTANKLINYYLKKFKEKVHLHDKIEFDILFTCLNFKSREKLLILKKFGFNQKEINEIYKSLSKILNLTIKNFSLLKSDLKTLDERFKHIDNSKMYTIDKIYWLTEDCKRYGTYPFAGFARCGFVAIELLNSLVEKKILSEKQKDKFMQSTNTITSDMKSDFNKLSKNKFLDKYGHIRPNSYEITSFNYREAYNTYFSKKQFEKGKKIIDFKFEKEVLLKINLFLKENQIRINVNQFVNFIKDSIKMREYSKFLFSKNLNKILEMIKMISQRNGINCSDAAFLEISDINNLYYNLDGRNLSTVFKEIIKKNKKIYNDNSKVSLPEVILNKKDIYFFKPLKTQINFVGKKIITGSVFVLLKDSKNKIDLNNRIIFIENADPGYDFIFSHKILGLVTKFGGTNSHMAIRCAENGIQAAIGIGEKLFNNLSEKKKIQINGENQNIKVII
jgi:glutamine kinase